MHLHFERTVNAKSDCPILSLTWMGKVPDELPEVRHILSVGNFKQKIQKI